MKEIENVLNSYYRFITNILQDVNVISQNAADFLGKIETAKKAAVRDDSTLEALERMEWSAKGLMREIEKLRKLEDEMRESEEALLWLPSEDELDVRTLGVKWKK